jgi:hypothetical protein
MYPLLYYTVPATSDLPYILFIATYNNTSVQSLIPCALLALTATE